MRFARKSLLAGAVLVCTVLIARTLFAQSLHGVWTATAGAEIVDLSISYGTLDSHNTNGRTLPMSRLVGLAESQVAAVIEQSVTFRIEGDAGSITFTGSFRMREGSGHFSFEPNDRFAAAVRALGIEVDGEEPFTKERLFHYALNGLTTSYIRSMQEVGYRKESLQQYNRMAIFQVTPATVRELDQLGYRSLPAGDLVRMRIHGVTADYIRAMQKAGFRNLSVEDLVRSRIHGVTPEFAASMASFGYPNLTMEQLVRFRIHGVNAEYVRGLQDLGYRNVPAEDLVRMRIHGVSLEFVKELQTLGYHNVTSDDLT